MNNFKSMYFIGIGGISMSALAHIFNFKGFNIYGIDACESKLINQLKKEGMKIEIAESNSEFVQKSDIIVYTSAVSENHPDLKLAKSLGKKVYSRAELLGKLSEQKKTISISGCHGKTTTTGMIANCLLKAGKDPTIHIGGVLNNIKSNVYIGSSKFLVSEACEYKDSFLHLKNYISVILNIEEDHLDYFGNLENIISSFNKFIKRTNKKGIVIYNYEEKNKLKIPKNSISFGFNENANVFAKKIKQKQGKYSFDLYYLNKKLGKINLPCYGKHNILNALATCSVCIFLGMSFKNIKEGIESFQGIERRFEIMQDKKALIFHDYAHHPHEIESCINTCEKISHKGKVIVIFQPHTFTRTRDLYSQFLNCFNSCDEVWLLPIYPAREKPIKNITSLNLSNDLKLQGKDSKYFNSFDECEKEVLKYNKKGNIIAFLGAGDINKLANRFKST